MDADSGAISFALGYLFVIILMVYLFIIDPIIQKYKKKYFWIYGHCNGIKARKHSLNKNVQFVMWKKGEHGHKNDYWINFDSSHWENFTINKP